MKIDTELSYLTALIDDPDYYVESIVMDAMYSRGPSVIKELFAICKTEKSRRTRDAILEKINFLNREFVLDEIRILAKQKDPLLKDGLYLVSKLFDPSLKKIYFDNTIISIAGEFVNEISDQHTAMERVNIFNHIFYKRLNFTTQDIFMLKEKNANLLNVLKTNKGNPITIAILYFVIARVVGLQLSPLCFQSGFIPVYIDENKKSLFYVNIFKDGEIFSEENLNTFFKSQGLNYSTKEFRLRKDKTLIIIYLEALFYTYSSKGKEQVVSLINRALELFGDERFLLNDMDE